MNKYSFFKGGGPLLKAATALLTPLLLSFLCTSVRAQVPVGFGESYTFSSEVLGEDRTINVLLPREYEDSTANKYPVFYLLDGAASEDFFHVAGLLRYYQDHLMMPPAILVGIANTDRKRDMTYPSSDPRDVRDFPTTGGSATFIRFLQSELPDFVGQKLRTNEHRTLIGQSLAGLLATELLLHHPESFNDYIIVSPSLWWDREGLYHQMDSLVGNLASYPERLFVSAGTEYPVMVDGSRKLGSLLEPHTDAVFLHLPQEDHNTILHEALNRALDLWYDPTVIRPYYFANRKSGLDIRSGPGKDSTLVGELLYGQSLGVISGEPGNEAVVDGLAGKWIYIGSDAGRGWVFDAYVSPVRVYEGPMPLKEYALNVLGLTETLLLTNVTADGSRHNLKIFGTAEHKYIEHHPGANQHELQIGNLTEAQAMVVLTNYLTVNNWPVPQKQKKSKSGMISFKYDIPPTGAARNYEFTFSDGLLSIRNLRQGLEEKK